MPDIKEPLTLSAPLARLTASRLCRKDPVSGEDCAWYHGLWQDLRLMGLAATPEHQADFFFGAFETLSQRYDRLRLLISGAADYSILAHVIWACKAHNLHADITVLDACDTPLFLNNWYADRVGHKINTIRVNIFDYRAPIPFDVVCGHSFLGQFAPHGRIEVVEKWRQILNPGGSVLIVNRIRETSAQHKVGFSQSQAATFRASVMQQSAELPAGLQPEPQEFARRVENYIQRLHVYALSADDIMSLFRTNNFRIDDFSLVSSGNIPDRNISGLAIPNNAEHACVIATKIS
ncbi:MAG: hypothetical protein Q8K18_16960 [Burkholderiales bacterium]|nr:hypothetical protein [Burkholderiales bacterium]